MKNGKDMLPLGAEQKMNEMKRYGLLIALLCLAALPAGAQDMPTLFARMPDRELPQLETPWRKDLIDLYRAGREARLQNTMNGYSRLLALTDDYLLLEVTQRSRIEMKMLPLINGTHILCVVTTVEGPAPDSRIAFYTTEWQPLPPAGLFTPPAPGRFLRENIETDSDAFRDAIAGLDMDLIQYRLSPDDLTLTAAYATPLYLSKPERAKVAAFLRDDPLVFTWDRSSFR
jgi:hypothetical protein